MKTSQASSRRKKIAPSLRWIEIDLSAIEQNVRVVRNLLDPAVKFTAVVKADAYGHGAPAVARTVLRSGADSLGVAYLEEALALRHEGVKGPLLVMGPIFPEEAATALRNDLVLMVDSLDVAKALQRAAGITRPARVHVKVNLGLYRWGIPLEQARPFLKELMRMRNLKVEGVFAHPGYMTQKNGSQVAERLDGFLAAVRAFSRELNARWELHAADSALLLDYPEYRLDRVRVGNLIYGINPSKKHLPLKNPWTAMARLVHVERLLPGQAVGYGGEFVATARMSIGTLAVGYSHGLTLEPASRWINLGGGYSYWGTLRGAKCPLVGRVGMGHCLVDLTAVPTAKVGDIIQLPLRRTAVSNWEKVYK